MTELWISLEALGPLIKTLQLVTLGKHTEDDRFEPVLRDEIVEWCDENLSASIVWVPTRSAFRASWAFFETEADAIAFKLRWL